MSPDKIARLEKLISGMYLPPRRKQLSNKDSLRWLARNIGTYNKDHANFRAACDILREILGDRYFLDLEASEKGNQSDLPGGSWESV